MTAGTFSYRCTGREPTLVGKPSPLMIDYIVSKYAPI